MRKRKGSFRYFGLFLGIIILIFLAVISCKKDDDNQEQLPATEATITQDAEAQDAVIDNLDQKIDNGVDNIIENKFSTLKAGDACATITNITNGNDTVNYPKQFTITYNCKDTINGEVMTQTGAISVSIDTLRATNTTGKWWRNRIKRTITFTNFTVATDSSSITINGTRIMKRLSNKISVTQDALRVEAKDSITSDIKLTISYEGVSKDITRLVKKTRNSILYLKKYGNVWVHNLKNDTITFTGSVTGTNAKAEAYSRIITTPVKFTFCPYWPFNPIISQGRIDFVAGSNTFAVEYAADGCKTKVTASKGGKTKMMYRSFKYNFRKWW